MTLQIDGAPRPRRASKPRYVYESAAAAWAAVGTATAIGPFADRLGIAEVAGMFSAHLRATCAEFRDGEIGAVVFENIGPGSVPYNALDYTDLPAAATLLLALVSLVGTPVAAVDEWEGAVLTDVKPTPGYEATASSKGTAALPAHQESQHLESPPDGLALLVARGGSSIRLASMGAAVEELSEETRIALQRPQFVHQLPASYGGGAHTTPTPVLLGTPELPELKVDLTTTKAETPEGTKALRELADALDAVSVDVALEPGSLILLNNRMYTHGRGALHHSDASRWLIRSLFVFDALQTRRHNRALKVAA